ncbi:MAG: UvrD-helicase domain-containing protein [Planctomycetota bacterium]|nr:UvrD-helicase domain-containing protein [Planctomycetota bacterium]
MSTAANTKFPNVVIRASAGTGKTFRLSNRFIGLVADGQPQDAILASTFTRKAAGEILERVLLRLAEAALDDGKTAELARFIGDERLDRPRCLALLRDMVHQLHRLRVGTLDQFFIQIARSFSLELALPPGWQVIDEVVDERLRAAAVRNTLNTESTDDVLRLVNLLTKGEAARSVSEQILGQVKSMYEVYLEARPEAWDCLKKPKMVAAEEIAAKLAELEEVELPADKRFEKAREKDIENFRTMRWEEFAGKGLAAKVADGSNAYYKKEIPPSVVEIYQTLIAHAKAVIIATIANQNAATYDLLERFDQRYQRLKMERRAMRFADVTRCLSGGWVAEHASDVLYRLDSNLTHMLLDEFQDTSLLQWQVLRPFAHRVIGAGWDGKAARSFFCVGDVKQAIYGWRGGVAEIFEAIDRELGGLRHESLNTSFRSSRPVIDTVNRVFTDIAANPVLAKYPSAGKQWGGRFDTHATARGELAGYCRMVTSRAADGDEEKQKDVTLSYAADEIKKMREAAPGADIGVLVRKNDTVGKLIYELRRRGLRASEEGGNPLTDSPAVVLILSLLRLADHPGDTAARYHLANSALGRALEFTNHEDSAAARRLADAVRARLMSDGYGPMIDDWTRILADVCEHRDLGRLVQLVEMAYGYEADATSRPGDFAEMVENRRVEDPTSASLRVMTVHQSKGLQFDIVVLPEMDARLYNQTPQFVTGRNTPTEPVSRVCRYVSEKTRELLPKALQKTFEDYQRRKIEESLCLLYVAVTRAVHALHIIVPPSAEREKSLPTTFAGVLRAALCHDTQPLEQEKVVFEHGDPNWAAAAGKTAVAIIPETDDDETPEPLVFKFAQSPARQRRGLERRSPSQLEGGPTVDLGERLRLDTAEALGLGTLVHAWFEQITWLEDGEPSDEVLCEIGRRQGFSAAKLSRPLEQFRRSLANSAVRNALSRQAYAGQTDTGQTAQDHASCVHLVAHCDLKSPSWQVRQEYPFAVEDGEGILSGTIDRLVVLYDGDRPVGADVIDFKTDAVSLDRPEEFEKRVEVYRPQIEAYRRAVVELTGLPADRISARLLFSQAGCVRKVGGDEPRR